MLHGCGRHIFCADPCCAMVIRVTSRCPNNGRDNECMHSSKQRRLKVSLEVRAGSVKCPLKHVVPFCSSEQE